MAVATQEKQIERIVEKVVFRILQKTLNDPDFGLELHPDFEKKLRKAIASRKERRLRNLGDVVASI